MNVTTRTTYNGTLDDLDGAEIEFAYPPNEHNDPLVHRDGDIALVAYLSHDNHCPNPLTEFDCQGKLWTRNAHAATDNDREIYDALGLDGEGQPNESMVFTIGEAKQSLLAHAVDEHLRQEGGHDLAVEWAQAMGRDLDLEDEDLYAGFHDEIWQDLHDGNFQHPEITEVIRELYRQHWQAIAGPFVVPISYFAERGGCMIRTTSWDGDPDDLPDGVWVADDGAEENIRTAALPAGVKIRWTGAAGSETDPLCAVVSFNGQDVFDADTENGGWSRALEFAIEQYGAPTDADLCAAAVKYAEAVVTEYASWVEGDAWGCIVEHFVQTSEGC